jgi:hypothetical protein
MIEAGLTVNRSRQPTYPERVQQQIRTKITLSASFRSDVSAPTTAAGQMTSRARPERCFEAARPKDHQESRSFCNSHLVRFSTRTERLKSEQHQGRASPPEQSAHSRIDPRRLSTYLLQKSLRAAKSVDGYAVAAIQPADRPPIADAKSAGPDSGARIDVPESIRNVRAAK